MEMSSVNVFFSSFNEFIIKLPWWSQKVLSMVMFSILNLSVNAKMFSNTTCISKMTFDIITNQFKFPFARHNNNQNGSM